MSRKITVYSKISKGLPISILVAGDSIGAGSGSSKQERNFANRLKLYLQDKYCITANVVNTSMGGNTSYAEYVRVSQLDKYNFDLVILCCGQNDNQKTSGKYYEALIRAVKTKWPDCEIISILQSSQRGYTPKIKTIQNLAEHYKILVADTIKPFVNHENGDYSSLTIDGIHPNDKGYAIYADVLENLIDTEISKRKDYCKIIKRKKLPEPIFPESLQFNYFREYTTNDLTREKNLFSCNLNIPESAHIGIDVIFQKGSNYYELIINDKTIVKNAFFREDPRKRYIIDLTEYIKPLTSGEKLLNLKFIFKEQADSFQGIFVSGQTIK